MKRKHLENSHRVVATTLILWAGSVALAGWEGVFAKLSPAAFGALALFTAGYAAAIYGLDRGVRGVADSVGNRSLVTAALAADIVLLVTAIALARADAAWLANLPRFPYVMSALFIAALAVVLHTAAFARLAARQPLRSAPARSPGGSPAAT